MIRISYQTALFAFLILSLNVRAQSKTQIVSDAEKQTLIMLHELQEALDKTNYQVGKKDVLQKVSPRSLEPSGELSMVAAKDWTSGFFPGVLWFLYEFTGDKKWEVQARNFTSKLENEKWNAATHDMGFKIYCSYGTGFRLTGDSEYRDVIVQSAKTLISRFNPKVGCLRSWDHNKDKWAFPVIIDNMMNLELLFAVTRLTGDSTYYHIAVKHANTTLKNHFRPDYSSYHVIDYDTITGNVLKRNTHQGYSHNSAWARGQAWALYGYTMCFRETKDPAYLKQAQHVATYMLNHKNMPSDLVPYWDFDAPKIPDEPRDASAAAIVASALYELSTYVENEQYYLKTADTILQNLTTKYRSEIGKNRGFLLQHSTGSKPMNHEVDVPLSYADYYYLEAIQRSE